MVECEANLHDQALICDYPTTAQPEACNNPTTYSLNVIIYKDDLLEGGLGISSGIVGMAGIFITEQMILTRWKVKDMMEQNRTNPSAPNSIQP